ncbi:alpha-glucosidase/alpha-galactosidase [Capsulimonas corticalis]|uniref:Alpha-glucosidase/alpha-galactosidase n=1 Tax=Capsulimonas corticalis TaxID=2219043 RepID=A0A402D2K8_9BACT|nr:alpha-glucosidase/alpha-galactosidase [Capsulimonas corticalis]BDI29954.1 alpha-glucosidase/alpha-galactosidase [Capsulimonas corticalis]
MKVVIVGAGSHFGAKLSRDILSFPEFQQDTTIALCDIDPVKLERVTRHVQRLIDGHGLGAKVESSLERRELLDGADFVVASISVGGAAYAGFPFTAEVNIPFQKYGLSQTVADTIGVGGVFRFLRTAPVQLALCHDMEELCPKALLLNYTNPMAMLTWLHSAGSTIANVGLCHSVQHTWAEIAGYLGIPKEEITYYVAGINHQAWYLTLRRGSEDLRPQLRACLDDPEILAKDRVRFELMRYFDYFVTESTTHCSEYHPYFRRTEAQIEFYGLKTHTARELPPPSEETAEEPPLPPLDPSEEYASKIIHAMVTGAPFAFNGNIMNMGLIDNLPGNCCVEVPCLVDANGVQGCRVGALPTQLAHLNLTNIAVQELAVEAFLTRSRDRAFQACALDPLAKSVLSLEDLRSLFDDLWAVEKEAGLLAHFD